jgi:hypothetical protein
VSVETVRERQALAQVTDRLADDFADRYSIRQVDRAVSAVHHRFNDVPIRDFVPILVERIAREELADA